MACKTKRPDKDGIPGQHRKDSDRFEIVPQSDGGYRLSVNGEVSSCFYWSSKEREKCLRTLAQLVGSAEKRRGG